MRMRNCSSHLLRRCSAGVLALALVACETRVDSRGNLPDPDLLAEIRPGTHSRQEVGEILGSPSSKAFLKGETWYYISERTETLAFFEPRISDRQVVIVQFDDKGVVSNVRTVGLEQGHEIKPVERETPTAGNELTVFEQLFGNIGRFNR